MLGEQTGSHPSANSHHEARSRTRENFAPRDFSLPLALHSVILFARRETSVKQKIDNSSAGRGGEARKEVKSAFISSSEARPRSKYKRNFVCPRCVARSEWPNSGSSRSRQRTESGEVVGSRGRLKPRKEKPKTRERSFSGLSLSLSLFPLPSANRRSSWNDVEKGTTSNNNTCAT